MKWLKTMSRSRRKPKGLWTGCKNTEFYRERNRSTRNKNKQILRNGVNSGSLDELEFIENDRNKAFDPWTEPSDGSFMVYDKDDPFYEKLSRK